MKICSVSLVIRDMQTKAKRDVKTYEGSTILSYLHLTSLPATVLQMAEMQDFWVRDKGQFTTHSTSKYHGGNAEADPDRFRACNGFMLPGNTKLGKPLPFASKFA